MKRIAFFDFDGTITTKDTLLEIIKYHKGTPWFYTGFLLNAPFLVAYKLKLISNQTAKQNVLRFFFRGMNITAFQQRCDAFATEALPALLRPKAVQEIDKHLANGTEVVIVSASASNWFKKWCATKNISVISTELEVTGNQLTGNITGINCHGEEKVRRIKANYNLADYNEVYCYGDTSGDKPMLSLATVSFYKPFR